MSIICNISSFNDREYVLCISISQLSGSVSNTLSRASEISIYILCLYVYFICIVVVQLPSHIWSFVIQIHIHWISDAIQPSHPLLPSSSAFKIFSSIRDFSNEYSGLISFKIDCLISLQSKGLSGVFSNRVFSAQLSLWSNSHIHTWLLEKPQFWLDRYLSAN